MNKAQENRMNQVQNDSQMILKHSFDEFTKSNNQQERFYYGYRFGMPMIPLLLPLSLVNLLYKIGRKRDDGNEAEMIPKHWRPYMPNLPGGNHQRINFVPTEEQLPDPKKMAKRQRYLNRRADPERSFDDQHQSLSEESEYYPDHSFSYDAEEEAVSLEPYRGREFYFKSDQQLFSHNPTNQMRRSLQSSTETIHKQSMRPLQATDWFDDEEESTQTTKQINLSQEQIQQIAKLQLTYAFVLLAPGNYRYNCSPQILDLITSDDYFKSHTYQEMRMHMQALAIPQQLLKNSIIQLYHGHYQNTGDYQYISMPSLDEARRILNQLQSKATK